MEVIFDPLFLAYGNIAKIGERLSRSSVLTRNPENVFPQ
jgi:hypothetical protein